ncbi:MAG: lysylphosphatidylglycerol synthase transmembrane domain-containing protein [Candidatus Hadarchaeia archaeon]
MSGFEYYSKKGYFKKSIPFLALGVAIIFLLAALTGIDKVINAVSQTSKRIYAVAFLVQVTAILTWLAKWKVLAGSIGLTVRTRRMFPILLSGIFVNTAVPSASVGGEPLRGYIFSKIGKVPIDQSFATIAADKAVDGIPFSIILMLSLFFILRMAELPFYAVILLVLASFLVVFGIIVYLYFIFHPEPAKTVIFWFINKLSRIISKFRPIEYIKDKIEYFMTGFGIKAREIFSNRERLLLALLLASIYWFLNLMRMWVVFQAMGESVSFWAIGVATVMGLVIHLIPIPGGLGVVESVYTFIFSAAGVSPGAAFTAAILDRGISFWFTSLFSAGGIAWSGLKLSDIRED